MSGSARSLAAVLRELSTKYPYERDNALLTLQKIGLTQDEIETVLWFLEGQKRARRKAHTTGFDGFDKEESWHVYEMLSKALELTEQDLKIHRILTVARKTRMDMPLSDEERQYVADFRRAPSKSKYVRKQT